MTLRQHFDRSKLPYAGEYFKKVGITLIGRGMWRSASCPFHDDTRPSLRIQYAQGAFKCMACGAHGGDDVLAFHRLRTGLSFASAARDLGAWSRSR